jgi:hypothetical protein
VREIEENRSKKKNPTFPMTPGKWGQPFEAQDKKAAPLRTSKQPVPPFIRNVDEWNSNPALDLPRADASTYKVVAH